MAEPSVIKDAAVLKHEALSSYEAAAALLQHKVEFPPDKESTSMVVEEWISEAYVQWVICSNYWRPAGIKKAAWNDVEYTLLVCLPLVNRELIDESGGRFNELVHRAVRRLFPRPGLVVLMRLLLSTSTQSLVFDLCLWIHRRLRLSQSCVFRRLLLRLRKQSLLLLFRSQRLRLQILQPILRRPRFRLLALRLSIFLSLRCLSLRPL